ncbi:NAD(P)-dependent oxidoreductase [Pyxidicoccus fallax]|uniref:NAD(P)-dependent oxidoreductase n=1 Tax=Pyxidicoccus fallax TaxID=394095 RepID=A0A848LWU8_9BACT|nr:NAD(P)-binding domain-containing protein [Pyxidicoccus fallax]NMO22567.1 NAD(P)-dependent oxidoreductase [Pyxidicoccus fallax]NPC86865.1 NAD(P)-dependent oxidoreductase [Pyxidicoccus fallax]
MHLNKTQTNDSPTAVTVIGLGSMGTALAQAFLAAGHPTTVWNRSVAKAAPLVAQGAVQARTVADAISASPLVIACLTTYDATLQVLEPATAMLKGRTLITLNTGTPAGARGVADWAARHGIRFLDGAVKNRPDAVGKPDTLLYYSGDKAVFDEYEATLKVLGGDTVFLGTEPDLAALYELAVGGTLLPALLGFFQGAALVGKRGRSASTLVPYTIKWLQMICAALPRLAQEIDTGDYSQPASSLGLFYEGIPYDHEIGAEGNIDVTWHEPMHDLLRRAVAEGHREHSISALIEMLRKPAPAA